MMHSTSSLLHDLELFHGEATPHRARVYARLPMPQEPGEWILDGVVRGPIGARQRTLPAAAALLDAGPGPTLLSQAVLTDPCGWSPSQPIWYEADIELHHNRQRVAQAKRRFAVKRIGPAARQLVWESKPHTLLGARVVEGGIEELGAWRDAEAAMVVTKVTSALAAEALRLGVPLIVPVAGSLASVVRQLRELAQEPAVIMAIVTGVEAVADDLRPAAPNMLLAESGSIERLLRPSSWAHVAMARSDNLDHADWRDAIRNCPLPVVVSQPASRMRTAAELRRAWERVRREPFHELFAGWIL